MKLGANDKYSSCERTLLRRLSGSEVNQCSYSTVTSRSRRDWPETADTRRRGHYEIAVAVVKTAAGESYRA